MRQEAGAYRGTLEISDIATGGKDEPLDRSQELKLEQLLLRVRTQLETGVQPGLIALFLQRDGYYETLKEADQFVRSLAAEMAEHRRAEAKPFIWAAIGAGNGAFLLLLPYLSPSSSTEGGINYAAYGSILFGIVKLVEGLIAWQYRPPAHYNLVPSRLVKEATIVCFVCHEEVGYEFRRSDAERWFRCSECRSHICDRCEPRLAREPGPASFLWWKWTQHRRQCPKCGSTNLGLPYYSV